MNTSKSVRERLEKLVEWHQNQARLPISSDTACAARVRFHEDSAKCIDALIAAIKDDALAFVDAADELYSAFGETKRVDKRQREALDEFARASNQWKQHPRK